MPRHPMYSLHRSDISCSRLVRFFRSTQRIFPHQPYFNSSIFCLLLSDQPEGRLRTYLHAVRAILMPVALVALDHDLLSVLHHAADRRKFGRSQRTRLRTGTAADAFTPVDAAGPGLLIEEDYGSGHARRQTQNKNRKSADPPPETEKDPEVFCDRRLPGLIDLRIYCIIGRAAGCTDPSGPPAGCPR